MSKPLAEPFLPPARVRLAFCGDDPNAIAATAQGAANAVRKMLGRIDEVSERHCRAVVGCKLLKGADCVPPCLVFGEAKNKETPT